ncbi:MAG TPA: YfhO family protein, partial [Pirellulaceae bacterium]|nr:YfhO family protein [Pirellulaceae bacterium]
MKSARWATLLAVAIPIAVLLGPLLVTDRSFAMRDAAHFYYPLFAWCARQWSAGSVPLWNPYENCGLPVLADASSSIFYPGKLLFLLPVNFALRYKLYVVLHVVLAAAGSYALARHWKASPQAAALAAIAYSCGGNVVFQYCNVVFLVGAAWLPLAALAADRMLAGRSWLSAVLLGLALALMILGGDPQAAYHSLLITALYAVVIALARGDATHSATDRFRRLGLGIGLTGTAAIVGFLLAAVQVLPSSEATQYSERAAVDRPRNIYEALTTAAPAGESRPQAIAKGFFGKPDRGTHQDLAYDFSVGPWRLVEYLWPNVAGRMLPTNRRWFSLLPMEGRTWTPTLYLGLVPLLLGLAGFRLWGRAEPRQRWLSWLVLIFTLGSFGYYGLGWLATEAYATLFRGDAAKIDLAPGVGGVYWFFVTFLPTYVYFRYPAKLLPLVSLGLSQLAALGWDRMHAQPQRRLTAVLLILGILSGILAFIIWSIDPTFISALVRGRGDSSLGPFDAAGARRDVLFAFLQAAVVALWARWLLLKSWNSPTQQARWQWSLLVLTAIEVAVANAWLVVAAPASVWRDPSPVAAAIQAASDESDLPPRVFRANLGGWRPPSFRQKSSAERPAESAAWEKDTLFPKYHLPSRLSLVESYGSIKLLDYESLLFVARASGPKQPDGSLLPHPAALRLVGTEFLLLPASHEPKFAEPMQPAAGTRWPEDAVLWRMARTLPRAWVVHDIAVLPPLPRPPRLAAIDQRSSEVLFPDRKSRDFLRTAVVETDQPLAEWNAPPAESPTTAEPCRITHYDPQRVVVEVELARPGLLVLGEAWYPGWQ